MGLKLPVPERATKGMMDTPAERLCSSCVAAPATEIMPEYSESLQHVCEDCRLHIRAIEHELLKPPVERNPYLIQLDRRRRNNSGRSQTLSIKLKEV